MGPALLPPSSSSCAFYFRLWLIHTCHTMGPLLAYRETPNGELYFQDYICIQLQMILLEGEREGALNTQPLSMKNSIVWIERADTWCRGEWAWGLVGDLALLPTSHFPRLPLSIIPSFQFHSVPTPFKMPHACNFSLPHLKKGGG